MFASVEELHEALRDTRYIADSVATTTVYLANCLLKPLLLLAERPSSHTPLQKQPARTLNVCSAMKASMKKKAIGKFDEPLEKLCVERKARSSSVDCDRCNPDQNVSGGVRYLAGLMWRFHNDLRLVAAAYYAGEEKIVQRVLSYLSKSCFSLPMFRELEHLYSTSRERSITQNHPGEMRCEMSKCSTLMLLITPCFLFSPLLPAQDQLP